jgi:uncharacterized protein
MKVVLDTNVLLVAISSRSPYHWVLKRLEAGDYTLCVTHDILEEYEEIVEQHLGLTAAQETIAGLLQLPNHEQVEKYYFWNLITQDPDDNKFVDCAVACNATFIVTEDKHFRVLADIPFPKVEVIGVEEFKCRLE